MSEMSGKHFTIEHRTPTAHDYLRLRESIGCDPIEAVAVERALKNSLFSVCAVVESAVIGFCRVVGDGGLYFFIEDIMVEPEYDSEGIEELLMDEIMEYLKEAAPPSAFFCIKGCRVQKEQCKQFGFNLSE